MKYCKECEGRGYFILEDNSLKECNCVFKYKIDLYLSKVGQYREPKKEVTQFIKQGLKTDNSCQCLVPPPMPLDEFQGVLCKCLLWQWKHRGMPPSYKILHSYELTELWLGKREGDQGKSLFTFSEDILIVIISKHSNINNIRNPDIIKAVIFDRFRKGKAIWLAIHNTSLGNTIGISKADLEEIGVSFVPFRKGRGE
jgi:hypothetical protein